MPDEKKGGRVYRLPTEAEWEYACRAGTSYSFGDDAKKLGEYALYADNSQNKTNLVGQKLPNPWGLFDMHGNALEWCLDGLRDFAGAALSDPRGSVEAAVHLLRGGCWTAISIHTRSALRILPGELGVPLDANAAIGFRVVCDVQPRRRSSGYGTGRVECR